MNQHLQNILNTIQQDKNLSEEEKNAIIKSLKEADKEFEITNFKLDRTEKVKRTTAILLEETIEELEQKRKAVEVQNRELEIESSLERVRAVAMSMMKADDLLKICEIQFNELKQLGFSELRNALIGIFHDEKNYFTDYDYSDFAAGNIHKIPYHQNSLVDRAVMRMKSANDAFTEFIVEGEELKEWKAFRKQNGEYEDTRIENAEMLYYYFYSINNGNIGISTFKKISDDQLTILKRFRNVFDLAYKRYVDITTAEAQAREAKIEAALEKVRSRSLAVHKSNEFNDVIKVVFEKLQELGFRATAISINTFIENSNNTDVYLCGQYDSGSGQHITHYVLPHFDEVISNERVAAQKGSADFFTKTYNKEDKDAFYKKIYELSDLKYAPGNVKQTISNSNAYTISLAISKKSMIVVNDFEGNILSENEIDVIKRFARVFEQSYIRFLDLQKSEEQSREAQIQLALERVRARTMAMQHSNELPDAANLLFQQVQSLGMPAWSAGYCTWNDDKSAVTLWMSTEGSMQLPFTAPTTEDELFIQMRKGQEEGKTFHVIEMGGEKLAKHYRYMRTLPVVGEFLDSIIEEGYPLPTFQVMHHAYYSKGFLLFITYEPVPDAHDIFQRFAKVFDQTYTRFLDLQKAEAQARESQIEVAVERVRAQSMAMHQTTDLNKVNNELFNQLKTLEVYGLSGVSMYFFDEEGEVKIWDLSSPGNMGDPNSYTIKFNSKKYPVLGELWEHYKNAGDYFTQDYPLEKLKKAVGEFRDIDIDMANAIEQAINNGSLKHQWNAFGKISNGLLGVDLVAPASEDTKSIVIKMSGAFNLAYKRFLDLQKAEAQAREAKIEAALERTRTQSMIMQHSKELDDTLRVFHEQVLLLNIPSAFSFLWLPDEEKDKHIFWAAWKENISFKSKAINYPLDRNEPATAQCLLDWKSNELIVSYHVPPAGVANYFAAWQELIDGVEKLKPEYFSGGLYYVEAFMKYGCFGVLVVTDLTEVEKKILGRFAIEFERTYRRFLDLQKAEAQAREAQIEAALEKVRSRSLAMHASSELKEVISVLFVKLRELAVTMDSACILTFDESGKGHTVWAANPDLFSVTSAYVPYSDDPIHKRIYEERQTGNFIDQTWTFEEKNSMYAYLFEYTDWKNFPDELKKTILNFEGWGFTGPVTRNSATLLVSYSNKIYSQHEKEIINRVGKVFDQAYTRFLDLQKSEAQAREAQIESALEKVRSRSMGMQKSEELLEVINVVTKQLEHLGFQFDTANFITNYSDMGFDWYISTPGTNVPANLFCPSSPGFRYYNLIGEHLKNKPAFYSDTFSFEEKNEFFHYVFSQTLAKHTPEERKQYVYKSKGLAASSVVTKNVVLSVANYQMVAYSEEENDIIKRIGKVFEQSYTRFLDLKKAEAQSKESQIEAALERVRSRTLAMQKSDELAETAAVLFRQLILLGIQPNRLYIAIVKDDSGTTEFWITDEDGTKVSSAFETNLNDNPTFQKMFEGWKAEKKSLVIDMHGEELQDYFKYLSSINVPFKGGLTQKRRLQDIAYFSKGFIGMASPEELPAETLQLLERFAAVFNLTYTRFNDLQVSEAHAIQAEQDLIAIKEAKQKAEIALTELQATQKQLIQSEKMASLGELTAGIAHEIQNPLNFVNNFSEVSVELIQEMIDEVEKGNNEEAKAIADDLIQNLEKINQHGKRADAIVKGMLQHSRTTSAIKESTDISKLADEYLRLAYHGLRAKDKSFNATLKTDYDERIDKINVIPQDIGRVILNLITNAFYAVAEKKKQTPNNYEPTVTVSTSQPPPPAGGGRGITITVTDNGNGIPSSIKDKIFQPFFTTKPTGQGTGLGLSLTYDIIKAHGGEIKVETKEGEGTAFIIQLPIV